MIKKTVTFEDFDGNTVTEDFYFHLSKAELVELELSEKDGLGATIQKIVESEDNEEIIRHFKKIVTMAYGKKSPDGRRFMKTQEILDDFLYSNAYSEVFLELATNADAGAEFIQGILPKDFNIADYASSEGDKPTETVELGTAKPVLAEEAEEDSVHNYTRDELLSMPQEKFDALAGKDPSKMSKVILSIAMERKNKQQG